MKLRRLGGDIFIIIRKCRICFCDPL